MPMNAADLEKYQRLLSEHADLRRFLHFTNDPAWIVVRVPSWIDRETRRTTSESGGGVFIDHKPAMTIIIDQARQATLAQIQRIEADLTANGITFPIGYTDAV